MVAKNMNNTIMDGGKPTKSKSLVNSNIIRKRRFNRHSLLLICFWFFISTSLISCNDTKSNIDEKCRSGVVLILNQYYYTLTLSSGDTFYFSGDSDGNIVSFEIDSDSAANCVMAATGTGFIISDDGKIATNKHVASRTVSDKSAVRFTKQVFIELEKYLENEIDSCEMIKDLCQTQFNQTSDSFERTQLAQLYNAMDEEIKTYKRIIRELNHASPEDATIEYHSSLKVAYNGTFVNSTDDMFPCTLRDTASQDIAIIQLNSKQTPPDKYIFELHEKNMLEHYSFGEYLSRMVGGDKNDELYLIGFNHGFDMAITDEGIYSQCTEGKINQTQKDIIQYSISTEPGSSGSPVLNRRGQLVAINFAGFRNTQNFNYGIKERHLYDLMRKSVE